MNARVWTLALFVCVAAVQLAMPAGMIARREATLRKGQRFLFRTKPVDPYDAFRGRYVWLGIEGDDKVPALAGVELERGDKVYVLIDKGEDGFARFTGVACKRPGSANYVNARVGWQVDDKTVQVRLPFNRFYMDETLAPEAERTYWRHSTRKKQDAYVAVRIRNGYAVIEDLFIAGKSVRDYVRERMQKQGK